MSNDNWNEQEFQSLVALISEDIQEGGIARQGPDNEKRLQSYWKIGQHIQNFLSERDNSAETLNSLCSSISARLALGKRTLYYTVRFYSAYHDFSQVSGGINWTSYRSLLSLESQQERDACIQLLTSGKLSSREFEALLKTKKEQLVQFVQSSLHFTKGIPYLYAVRQISETQKCLDIGFYTYLNQFQAELQGLPDKTTVSSVKSDGGYSIQPDEDKTAFLYTYKAFVLSVIDGDTLKLSIDLGFSIMRTETIRLNKIDAAELATGKGVEARDFVIDRLSGLPFIVIRTHKKDKYARYLADVFYLPGAGKDTGIGDVLANGVFLNQELIDHGLAVKYYVG